MNTTNTLNTTDYEEQEAQPTYRIVRYQQHGHPTTIKTGLTLEEAREWCSDPDTSGDDWFDGYTQE